MSARNRFMILLGIIFVIAATYYYFSTDHSRDLVLIGTVDANQVIVSAQVEGRIQKLLVDEGTPVKAGDLIAVLDPSELQAQEAAADSDDRPACSTKSPRRSTPSSRLRVPLRATWPTHKPSFRRRRRSCCKPKPRSSAPRATAAARLSWPRQGWRPIRSVCRRKPILQAAQATRAGAAGHGEGRAGRPEFGHCAYASGECGEEHGGFNRGRSEECGRAEKSGGGPPGLHQCLCAGEWNCFGARGAAGRSGQHRRTDRYHRGLERHVGPRGDPGNVCRPHWLWRRVARALARRHRHSGKVFFKGVEGDFATQRDVSRHKRDIKTIVLKVRLDNPKGAYVPGMTAEVLVSPEQLKGGAYAECGRGGAAMMVEPNLQRGSDGASALRKEPTGEADLRSRLRRPPLRSTTSSRSTATSPPSTTFRSV